MKKAILIALLLIISGCTVGELKPERQKLYDMGNDICDKDPSRCINGIPW